jgi:Na+-driven multidrug efflux pump
MAAACTSFPNEAVLSAASMYLTIRAVGAPVNSVLLVLQAACRGMSAAGLSMRASVTSNAVNLLLDPIAIFTLRWGIVGAAVATVSGQVRWAHATFFALGLLIRGRSAEKCLQKCWD